MEIIKVSAENCVGCNACIRNCPANEANVTKILEDGRSVTTVNEEKCIKCGECIRICAHGARDFNDDTDVFLEKLYSRSKMILLVTPGVKAAFNGCWRNVLHWFKQQGIAAIYDVSLGADICTWAHLKAIERGMVKEDLITQPCAAIVNYILKYLPDLAGNLSPVHSPILCTALYVRRVLKRQEPIVVLTPCVAKKTEFTDTGTVDYNLTFAKIKQYFDRKGIDFKPDGHSSPFEFDDMQGLVGSIYSRPGGLRDNIWMHNQDIVIATSEGVHKVYPELDMYAKMPKHKHPDVFDVLSCEHGCNIGSACGHPDTVFDVMGLMKDVEKATKKKRKTGVFNQKDKQYAKFDETLNLNDFLRTYRKDKNVTATPDRLELEDIFATMGKYTKVEQTFNCHACGYKSCKDMATAIFRGLNVRDNCIVYAKSALHAEHTTLSNKHDEIERVALGISAFSEELASSIESTFESTRSIHKMNGNMSEKARVVNKILDRILDVCGSAKELNGSDLDALNGVLQKLNSALKTLELSISESELSSNEIDSVMKAVEKETGNLNNAVHELVAKFRE